MLYYFTNRDSYLAMLAFWVIQTITAAVLAFMVGFDWLVPASAAAPTGAMYHDHQHGGVQPTFAFQPTGSSLPGQPQFQQAVHSPPKFHP